MKKYFIEKLDNNVPVNFQYMYRDEDLYLKGIWIGESSDPRYSNRGSDVVWNIESEIAFLLSLIHGWYEKLDMGQIKTEEEIISKIVNFIQTGFHKWDGSDLTNRDVNRIYNSVFWFDRYNTSVSRYETSIIPVLNIIRNDTFVIEQFTNKDKSKSAYIIYPKSYPQDEVENMKHLFFGEVFRYAIYLSSYESAEQAIQAKQKAEVSGNINTAVMFKYTYLNTESDLKNWAAKILGCNPNDVEIIK